jgi:hypothetical protein
MAYAESELIVIVPVAIPYPRHSQSLQRGIRRLKTADLFLIDVSEDDEFRNL